MASKKRPELAQTTTIEELPLACSSEAAAVAFLETKRWGTTPACVHCGSVSVYKMTDRKTGERNRRFLWRCHDCKKQYSVRVGTIFEDSAVSLNKWALAFSEVCSCKNGVSAMELQRKVQVTYKTALFMLHRIRHAMAPTGPEPNLDGTIEADETYVDGRPRFRRVGKTGNHPGKPKAVVFAAVQRGGKVRTKILPSVTAANLRLALTECVDPNSRLVTDDLNLYWAAGRPFAKHDKVKHSKKEYVNKEDPSIHTNTIEGFFSRIKRQINGTYHVVSKQHLHRYAAHAAWLYNNREIPDGDRVGLLFKDADGKRLMYREPA